LVSALGHHLGQAESDDPMGLADNGGKRKGEKLGGAGESNHTCASFMQMEPYSTTFEDLTVTQLYYGYVEHLPTINSAARAFAPDDNIFRNVKPTAQTREPWKG